MIRTYKNKFTLENLGHFPAKNDVFIFQRQPIDMTRVNLYAGTVEYAVPPKGGIKRLSSIRYAPRFWRAGASVTGLDGAHT